MVFKDASDDAVSWFKVHIFPSPPGPAVAGSRTCEKVPGCLFETTRQQRTEKDRGREKPLEVNSRGQVAVIGTVLSLCCLCTGTYQWLSAEQLN